ncbi:unnamed protein product [Polarella glacialis]|uniref:Poly [ADP-ribose] polymerase n=1 Tax=Polarella glacialis TaxID=89957 RepID=A0A813E4G5_POLGL|nr:unnamed protein product [Polarella glacialis]
MAGQIGQFASLKEGFFACANEHGHFKTGDPDSVRSLADFLGLDEEIVQARIDEIDADHNGPLTTRAGSLHTEPYPPTHTPVVPRCRAASVAYTGRGLWGTSIALEGPPSLNGKAFLPKPTQPSFWGGALCPGLAQPFLGRFWPALRPMSLNYFRQSHAPARKLWGSWRRAGLTQWELRTHPFRKVWIVASKARPAFWVGAARHRLARPLHAVCACISQRGAPIGRRAADHNGFVTFAEFAPWADRHTRNVLLGLAGVALKSRWQEGMPSYWTTTPAMKDTTEEMLSPGGFGARRGLPLGIYSQRQLDQANSLIDLAKFGKWTNLIESLTLRRDLLNVRPPYREYGIIHQAAYFGGAEAVGVLRQLVALEADVHVLTMTGRTALDVAVLRGSHLAVAYLEPLTSPHQLDARRREESAHAILDATKMARWEELFQKLQLCPDLVNARPEPREYAALHKAAFRGDVVVLQRLVDEFKADVCLRSKSGQTALQVAIASEKHQASTYLDSVMPTVHLHDEFVTFPEQVCVRVTDPEMLSRWFQALLQDVHKSHNNWTRDRRRATDGEVEDKSTPVPQSYEFVAAFRNENAALWRTYQINREIVKERCEHNASFQKWVPWTASGTKTVTRQGRLDFELEARANDWFLFHASIPEALRGIARTGFKMANVAKGADSTGGGLYGEGTYIPGSIAKVDEYARKRVALGAEFGGCRTAALCRVIGGRHFYTYSDIEQSDKSQFNLGALQGECHSTVGDRLKLKNTFREYVVYDGSHAYLEYIIYYKRLGIDEKYC